MGLYWWLSILACISYCMLSKAEEYDEQVMNDASVTPTEGSIHGFRPCLDESCSALSLDSEYDNLSWHVLSAVVRAQKNIIQVPDSVTRDPDVIVQHCIPLHRSTVDQISSIEARHPDIADIKMKVIEDFIGYISDFALLNTTGCDSPMSLIGYIKLAVRSLEVEYSQYCGENCDCVYTAGVEEDMASTSTTASTSESMEQTTYTPRLGDEGYETPCPEAAAEDSYEEIYAEDPDHSYGSSILVGSVRGVPGVNFPNYTDIPLTSFSCADKKYVPGFYADQETGCQVFHVCYEHRRESFLCPLGTTFNQPILACDYWYSSNCSLAMDYYEVNVKSEEEVKEEAIQVIKEIIEDEETEVAEEHSESTDEVYEEVDTKQVAEEHSESTDEVQAEVDIRQFLPVKAKVIDFEKPVEGKESVTVDKQAVQDVQEVASQIFDKMVSTATDFVSKTRGVIDKIPEPNQMKLKPSFFDWSGANLKPIVPAKSLAGVKVAAAIPAMKIAALKSAKVIPLAAKAAVAAAVPAAKIAAVKAAIPVAAVKTAIPVAAKVAAVKTAIPVAAKVAAVKTAIPVAAKVAAVKTAIPVAAKVAAVKTAIPVAAVKTAIPVAAKVAAVKTAIPVAAKVAAVKAAIPVAAKAAAVKAAIPVAAKAAAVKAAIPVAAKAAAVKAAIPVAAKAAAVKAAIPVAAKAAAVKAAIPVAAKAAAVKAAIPVAAKALGVKASIPVAAKALGVKASIPVAAKALGVKASIPLFSKAKLLAFPAKKAAISGVKVAAAVPKLAVPVLKTKMLAPVIKGKFLKAAAVPVLKAKVLPIKGALVGLAPVAKAKLIKAAAISPLTKKTLALGYMKLLKAKKLALMG